MTHKGSFRPHHKHLTGVGVAGDCALSQVQCDHAALSRMVHPVIEVMKAHLGAAFRRKTVFHRKAARKPSRRMKNGIAVLQPDADSCRSGVGVFPDYGVGAVPHHASHMGRLVGIA